MQERAQGLYQHAMFGGAGARTANTALSLGMDLDPTRDEKMIINNLQKIEMPS